MRKEEHVFVVQFLQQHLKNVNFIFLVVAIDEQTSVQRQIERGKRLIALSHSEQKENGNDKQIRLKDSDLDPNAAQKRFVKYNRYLDRVKHQLVNGIKAQFDVIDGTKSLQEVQKAVVKQLKAQILFEHYNEFEDK